MPIVEILRDIGGAGGLATTAAGIGYGVKFLAGKFVEWRAGNDAAREAEAVADVASEDTARQAIALAGTQAHHNSECLDLVREQGVEIGKVRQEVGNLREKLGRTETKLELCEERHDEKDGELLAMRSRIETLERRTPPPMAAE